MQVASTASCKASVHRTRLFSLLAGRRLNTLWALPAQQRVALAPAQAHFPQWLSPREGTKSRGVTACPPPTSSFTQKGAGPPETQQGLLACDAKPLLPRPALDCGDLQRASLHHVSVFRQHLLFSHGPNSVLV